MTSEIIKLLLADVDGTLVTPEKALTPRTLEAVAALDAAGVAFAITSGRPPRGLQAVVGPLRIATPIAAFNGGLFMNADLSVLSQSVLAPEVARLAIETLAADGLDVWVYCGTEWYVRDKRGAHVEHESHTVRFDPVEVADFDDVLDQVVKIVGVSDDFDAVERAGKHAQEACGRSASASRSQPYYVDVTHPEANKGAVVRRLSEMLGVPTHQIATIGDMPNDVLMFRESGFSIAMSNAGDDVKAAANEVTSSNTEEGFALAVERFVLPRAAG